jgi:hypothetical protein
MVVVYIRILHLQRRTLLQRKLILQRMAIMVRNLVVGTTKAEENQLLIGVT